MAIQGFVTGEVELCGPGPGVHSGCGLVAENVEVQIGEEELLSRHPDTHVVTYATPCSAKIRSLACDICRLRELGDMTGIEVGFSVERTGANMHALQPSLIRAVKRAMPSKLAAELDCDKENDNTGYL